MPVIAPPAFELGRATFRVLPKVPPLFEIRKTRVNEVGAGRTP